MFAVVEILPQKIEHQIGVDLILVLLCPVDGKDESAAFLVLGVLPFGLNSFLEILDWVDFPPFIFD